MKLVQGKKITVIRKKLVANFIVKWHSQEPVNKPIIESIMSDTSGTQGISFRCPGREITEHVE